VVLDDDVFDVVQLMTGKAIVESHLPRFEPDLRFAVVSLHVDMHRLIAVETYEVESVRAFI
jgi:hypothetical protein